MKADSEHRIHITTTTAHNITRPPELEANTTTTTSHHHPYPCTTLSYPNRSVVSSTVVHTSGFYTVVGRTWSVSLIISPWRHPFTDTTTTMLPPPYLNHGLKEPGLWRFIGNSLALGAFSGGRLCAMRFCLEFCTYCCNLFLCFGWMRQAWVANGLYGGILFCFVC